jgi:hypothetical protein
MNILINYTNKKLLELIRYYFSNKYNHSIYFDKYNNLNYDLIISINKEEENEVDKNEINIRCCDVILNNSEYFKLLIENLLNNKFDSKRYRLNSFLFFSDFLTGLETIIINGKKGEKYNLYPSNKDQINDINFLNLLKKRIKKILDIDILVEIKGKIYIVNDRKSNIKLVELGWRKFFTLEMIIDNFLRINYSKNTVYDLMFSVITNKKSINILSFISNLIKFNEENNILIVLHLDEKNYKIKKIYENSYVKVNNIYYDKVKGTKLELIPIIDNFNFLEELKINYSNYIYLSSNSRFIKQNKKIINKKLEYKFKKKKQDIKKLRKWHWNRFKKNKEIINIFKDLEIELTGFNLSGVIFDYILFKDIILFIKNYELVEKITDGYGIIEILIPSLSMYFLGYKLKSILKIYFEREKYIPKIEDVKKELLSNNIYIVKTIPDNFDSKIYKFIESLN